MLLLVRLAHQPGKLGLSVRPSLLIQCAETIFRIPDVCVYDGVLLEDVPTHPPLLTIEVASDTEPMTALTAKIRDHLSMGARLAIIVDPKNRTVLVQDSDGPGSLQGRLLRVETKKGILEIDFDALFAEMDQELSPE